MPENQPDSPDDRSRDEILRRLWKTVPERQSKIKDRVANDSGSKAYKYRRKTKPPGAD